ncbi:MAG: aldehyde dehydrogenase family protein [candidate division KSB1 bacterium]|nr:aldehyde dehydrogenase family protein [candidate division KSB1 bacterium]MDZ7273482.1 aldehyde dehydrogenase family protein [candidate division KSB1 bacterium]MDZ7286926.1 aldehyde dehydrogenase family protein [candidate division KSB1 bacterium]MDZ7299721.1 aldehyde dehydrogenase family protein [candidate division KSB1 bacterium]MDZ7305660.1 aldehyde dehydrogenase family protein [candidate division KSB1 bacterium]
MLKPEYPYYLANKPVQPNTDLPVTDKYTGGVVARAALADEKAIDQAIAAAVAATEPMRALPAFKRQAVLQHCVRRFSERAEELAMSLCLEAGKPIRDSRGEVNRLIDTFRIAAEEAVRLTGEVLPLDISPRAQNYVGMWKRVAIGPCSFISPFNFPLNLAAHKVAPAIAVGCPFVLKPASLTPIGALIIGEVLAETDLPPGAFSILPCHREGARLFTEDERLKLLSFTGSPEVGWELKRRAGRKKVVLELGGNAAVIIDADADLADAVKRVIFGGFYQSGQSCISVQRILVHEQVYESFREQLVTATRALKMGDPREEDTFIGPMISEQEAIRLENWINAAVKRGARLLCGGRRHGAIMEATLLENVPKDEKISCQEAFGPVAMLSSFRDFEQALNEVNDSRFGLQAGVFTRDIYKAHQAWDKLEVGGVLIGEVPSWRVDHMPYGGVKESGLGREGIRFAMEEMTEIRMMILRKP